jgi:antitoxin ParD1/3/4
MTTTTLNISLPDVMKDFVNTQLQAGGYSSTSDYVCELIRKDQAAKADSALHGLLMDGLNSGPSVPADAFFFNDIRERAIAASKE